MVMVIKVKIKAHLCMCVWGGGGFCYAWLVGGHLLVGVVAVEAGDDLHGDIGLAGARGAHHHGQAGVQARSNRLHLSGGESYLHTKSRERQGQEEGG